MAHVNCKFLHLAFKIFSSAIIFIFSLERSENSQLQIPNQQRTVQQKNNSGERHNSDTRKASRQAKTIRYKCVTRKREKETGGRGGVFCCSWRDGAVLFFFRGGTGRLFFFSEAGRGGCCFFPRRDGVVVVFFRGGTGWLFFFFRRDGTGRCFFFFLEGRDGRLFLAVAFFLAGRGKIVTPSRQRRFKPSRQPSM